jgi:hypothetical protein
MIIFMPNAIMLSVIYAESRVYKIVMLSVIVVMLNVVLLTVGAPYG